MLETFKISESDYEKKNFSASDYGKLGLDLYFRLIGQEETNPVIACSSFSSLSM